MNLSLLFARILFAILCIFFMATYLVSSPTGTHLGNLGLGAVAGILLYLVLFGFDLLFRRFNLRSFNTAIIGIFIGYLMGQALVLVFNAIHDISRISIHIGAVPLEMIRISLFLFGTYLGTLMTLRASDEFYVSIPFFKFTQEQQKKRDVLIDSSIIGDPRIIDLCQSGLLDHHIIIPRFILKELYAQAETDSEDHKSKARTCIETIRKLEEMPNLGIRYHDTDFPEVGDMTGKLVRLARLIDGNILTADISRVKSAAVEGVNIINMNSLSNALKPLMAGGEQMEIKVQRFGKEPNQGVGYLEDGTMVVINGGGDYVGNTIQVHVLSVKHTSSGRIIFCNVADGDNPYNHVDSDDENS